MTSDDSATAAEDLERFKKPPRRWLLPTITGLAGLIVGALIGGVGLGIVNNVQADGAAAVVASASAVAADSEKAAEEAKKVVFLNTRKVCTTDSTSAVVGDSGLSLTLDAKGSDDFSGLTSKQLWCIINGLKAPDAVVAQMEQTRALDGRQTATWGDISASWSYHPDSGMEAIFTVK